jgi:ABC-type lipoprotein release transport system permease subunit
MALALSRVLGSLLYGVGATDLITFVGVPLIFVSVAAVAIALPAWRAARIEPMSALRYD